MKAEQNLSVFHLNPQYSTLLCPTKMLQIDRANQAATNIVCYRIPTQKPILVCIGLNIEGLWCTVPETLNPKL